MRCYISSHTSSAGQNFFYHNRYYLYIVYTSDVCSIIASESTTIYNISISTTYRPYRSNCPSRGLQPVTVSDRHLLWPTDHQLKKQTKTMEAQTAAHSLTGGLVMLASLPSIFRANLSRINPSSVYQLQHCVCVCVSLSLFHSEGGRQQILDCLSIVST